MDSSPSLEESISGSPNPKNVYHIGGITVEFPYQPYGSQLAFMGRVISTLDRAERDGHCHALLESPTGTGKSLSLLCSALAWQQSRRKKNLIINGSLSKPAPEAFTDPMNHGGGFVPDNLTSGSPEPPSSMTGSKISRKKAAPTIFYASRTHSQIAQVIREYKKTTYRVSMAVLASRKHYCTNKQISDKDNVDEECKLLLSNQERGCLEFKNMHKVKAHPSFRKGGCHEVHDIEDLVKVGQLVKGCSFFAARSMADDAQLVFCPYSYIVSPAIRSAMEIDIKGAIIILDEAHNIEDIARDAGSVDVEQDALYRIQVELGQLSLNDPATYQPLHEMIQEIISWMERKKDTLQKHDFQRYFSRWTGEEALKELQEANISRQCFPVLQECARKAIKAASDAELEGACLSGLSATILAGLFSSLGYFFAGDGLHMCDYLLTLQNYFKRDAGDQLSRRRTGRRDGGNDVGGWSYSLSMWCLNPSVVFKDLANLSMSVILTSGTLSPMSSFSSELGVQFGTCLEAPHVIDAESQIWAAVVSRGPGNYPLNASYKTADGYAFQDALGSSLEEICRIVPGGALIFFPSYKLMEKLCNRWRETGQWSRLNSCKKTFVEPRGSQDDFERILKGYYTAISHGNKPTLGKKKRSINLGNGKCNSTECTTKSKEGAAMLAVCRGKVSEGIDFTDEFARVVILVGIPFPNINDIQVAQKKKYNDMYRASKGLLSGSEWYCQQAFRALNQAAGRCVRHKFDYGAIIYLDERFLEDRNRTHISKWIKKSIKQYENFDQSLEDLKSFFQNVKERVGKNFIESKKPETDDTINSSIFPETAFVKRENKKANKGSSKLVQQSIIATARTSRFFQSASLVQEKASFIQEECQNNIEDDALGLASEQEHFRSYTGQVDVKSNSPGHLRCSLPQTMDFNHEDSEMIFVRETPGITGSPSSDCPESFGNNEGTTFNMNHASFGFPSCLSSIPTSLSNSNASSVLPHSLMVTPDKSDGTDRKIPVHETESTTKLSVNSHVQKKRKPSSLPCFNLMQVGLFDDDRHTEDSEHVDRKLSSVTTVDGNPNVGCSFGTNYSGIKSKKGDESCVPLYYLQDKRLQVFCSHCRNPLGHPNNQLYMECTITSSSKTYLADLLKRKPEVQGHTITSISVVLTDVSSIDPRICNRNLEDSSQQGVWCREDGCVFCIVYCPFCITPDNLLGVQVMATDASNIHLLNKILFYHDLLIIKNPEASNDKPSLILEPSPDCEANLFSKGAIPDPFQKFSYSPKNSISDGWRTTRSKLRLPRNGSNSYLGQ
ncbi:Fanconi anemia group J protein homolog [Impatiens glandulifera]|uniref:Fanconi anemia group J protein homolog n=1 Tax=Impatiens glandulifera TaxID=253017 RepID=UPI001FB182A2|nr:Fanconi anemia group J protein homolog [Impatiens glandulifera]